MNGVLYIAFTNQKYINEAIFSATSLKKHNPNLSVTIITDFDLDNKCFDIVKKFSKDKFKGIRCKQDFIEDSPYDNTIYLDTDTYVNDNICDLFILLEKFDIALAHDYARKREINEKHPQLPPSYLFSSCKEYSEIPYCFPEFNGGVIVFKKSEKVINFFKNWKQKYKDMKHLTHYDQPSFRIALWQSNLNISTLPIEYNCRSKQIKEKNIKYRKYGIFQDNHLTPRIYHWHDISKLKNINEINLVAQDY